MIELTDINKTYWMGENEVKALDDVTLTIDEKEFVAILGPSGSGKSTLMNIIGCLDSADSGRYLLDGQDVSACTDRQLALVRNRKIGFIFQQFNLLPKLTAFENVELPLVYQGLSGHERHERVMEALGNVGLTDRMHHRPSELSGGQQQRVAIARALATHPAILLADEPTGNLDSKSGKDILALLKSIHEKGNTIVLITHDQNIAREADRRVSLSDGQIASDTAGEAAL
jgi:putative ABC transport system ATP-binding protein